MRNIFMSFLGLGSYRKNEDTYRYSSARYILDGQTSQLTEFVQVAEIEMIGADTFDAVYILGTEKSLKYHFENLQLQMQKMNILPLPVQISDDLDAQGQWTLFEIILKYIEHNDALTLDLTHGFRSMPIVVSAAINFLQKSRNITLSAVYYGAYDKDRDFSPLVNMKDFYLINEWADGVSRLVEDADASKMLEIAQKAPDFQTGGLNDERIIQKINKLTDSIRNVDVNRIGDHAYEALDEIMSKREGSSDTAQILLDLVIDKYASLVSDNPYNHVYDNSYFKIQIEIIKLLLDHNLFMQAYTVMREYVASLAMIPFENEGMNNKKRKKRRSQHAERFVSMLQYAEDQWVFQEKDLQQVHRLMPFYQKLKDLGIEPEIRQFMQLLLEYRNGFDHAWTTRRPVPEDLEKDGWQIVQSLEGIQQKLIENELMPEGKM